VARFEPHNVSLSEVNFICYELKTVSNFTISAFEENIRDAWKVPLEIPNYCSGGFGLSDSSLKRNVYANVAM